MFNAQELWRYGFLDCSYCKHINEDGLCNKKGRNCNFTPPDWESYINFVVNNLRLCTPRNTKETRLTRKNKYKPESGICDDAFTLDTFYVQLINDSLRQIGMGHPAYVFSLHHIVDILRFEPNISVRYIPNANSFCVQKK